MSDIDKLKEAMNAFQTARQEAELGVPTSDVVETQEQDDQVEATASESVEDVKETVILDDTDERGVPWKNKAKELERRLLKVQEEASAKYQELSQKLEEAARLDEIQAMNILGGKAFANTEQFRYPTQNRGQANPYSSGYQTEEDGIYEDPSQRPLTHADFQRAQLKQHNDLTTYNKYKEYLDNRNSPLVREVTRRLQQKASLGIDVVNDPFVAADVVAAAYGDLVQQGQIDPLKQQRKVESEVKRRTQVDAASLPATGAPAKKPEPRTIISADERAVVDLFKRAGVSINDDEYKTRRKEIFGK